MKYQTGFLLAALIFLIGCGSGSQSADPEDVDILTIEDVWVRAMPDSIATLTAAYAEISNNGMGMDELIAVTVDVAAQTELHETTIEDEVMRMREVESIVIPPGSTVSLVPGGHHVMLMGLDRQLVEGDSIEIVFQFGSGTSVSVNAPVLNN